MKNFKKLVLKKETLSNLQQKQMQALIGGAAMMSSGTSSMYTCSGDSCICPSTPSPAEQALEAASCCKGTCN
ncbi:class I lanthipeptide [Pedobacter sp. CFBP9032]|uniref:class I lanthipeptide n=1 Tax=Pedobacter sp. CFBP9032 TaxID=3096539 RepID=UPI002A6ADCD9|nr:class I lanthipeptide [Pedobacter sp. CFBP9032]MDY0905134.1 class I lanthipeptide [Pedobacter sp. CFBP9032]